MFHGMRFVSRLVVAAGIVAGAAIPLPAADPLVDCTKLELPVPGGWVMLPDNVTLVVSQPKTAELLFFDTVAEELKKRVELEFAPGLMLLAGNSLYITVDGAAVVHEVDLASGKSRKEFGIPGSKITDLSGIPSDRFIYAATSTYEVFSIETKSGQVQKTDAVGNLVIVDPNKTGKVYTGVKRNDTRDVFIIKSGPKGEIHIIWDDWGPRSAILKYISQNGALKLDSAQENAAVNGYTLTLHPEGKQIIMTGGGGWRPPPEVSAEGGYTAVFSTDNLKSIVAKAPGGQPIAFHPVLRIGVSNEVGRALKLFDSKSYVEKQVLRFSEGGDMRPLLLTFCAKGTKVAVWNGELVIIPLELTAGDRALLAKAYGRLPAEPKVAARPGTSSKAAAKSSAKVETTVPSTAASPESEKEDPSGLLALAGFNSKKGLGTTPGRPGPYPLDAADKPGGSGERGWKGPWPANGKATFQSESVFEGDGALRLLGTQNYARGFSRALSGQVEIEHYLRIPDGGNMACYVWQEGAESSGPMWRVEGGKFGVLAGDGAGSGKWTETGIAVANEWQKVIMHIDVDQRLWEFLLPEKNYASGMLKFRGNPQQLREINFLSSTPDGIYIDAIQVRRATFDKTSAPSEKLADKTEKAEAKPSKPAPPPKKPAAKSTKKK
jgi:hypothetical protein